MKIIKQSINNFMKNEKNILEVKKLIYDSFMEFNLLDTEDKAKIFIKKIYSPEGNIEDTIKYREKSDSIIICYDNNKKIIGVLIGKKNKITNLFVDVGYQNKGIGGSLIEFFEKVIKKKWYTSIYLKPSKYAVKFYIRKGFKKKDEKYLEKFI